MISVVSLVLLHVGLVVVTLVQHRVVTSVLGVVPCVIHHAKLSVRITLAMHVLKQVLRQ